MTFDWDEVWDRKGRVESNDPFDISGFEHFRNVDTEAAANKLIQLLGIEPQDQVLEIGCGGGLLARHLQLKCNYTGTDRSPSIVKKIVETSGLSVLRCDANDLIFRDKSFDHVFAFSVFQYFPNHNYAQQCIAEMMRVARKSVCVSDIRAESPEPAHLLFDESFFEDWHITDNLYNRELRSFTAFRLLGETNSAV